MELGKLTQEKAELLAESIASEHKTGLHRNSAIVRAAIQAGWLVADDPGELEPAQVTWMAQNIADEYVKAITVPKA